MTTSQPNVLQLARQGDPRAIGAILNRSLQPKGITSKVLVKANCLQIKLESAQLPHSSSLLPLIQKQLSDLKIHSINVVKVFGYNQNDEIPAWTEEFDLEQQLHNSSEGSLNLPTQTVSSIYSNSTGNRHSKATKASEETITNSAVVMKLMLGLCGLLTSFMCFVAGAAMQSLRSQSGNTVAEAYYQATGRFVIGLSFFVGPLLIYFAYSVPPVGFDLSNKRNKN